MFKPVIDILFNDVARRTAHWAMFGIGALSLIVSVAATAAMAL